jgi:hypothetical protein
MVPRIVRFSVDPGTPEVEAWMELVDPLTEAVSLAPQFRSSKGRSEGGVKPDLYFSTTSRESYVKNNILY